MCERRLMYMELLVAASSTAMRTITGAFVLYSIVFYDCRDVTFCCGYSITNISTPVGDELLGARM